MNRPIPKDQITINDAVELILQTLMANKHQEIQERLSYERLDWELQQPSDFDVDTAYFEFSKQLNTEFIKHMNRGKKLLRQWLRDGEIRAFYSDALSRDSAQIMPTAWSLALTDHVINGGDFNMHEDPRSAGPVGVLRCDLERVLALGGVSATKLPHRHEASSAACSLPPTTVTAGVRLLQRPTGRGRISAGTRIALQELYGSEMGREIAPKERATAVVRWLRERNWSYPKNPEKTIYNILNPEKRG